MKSHRISYIDALRGLTMILVVYSHIQVIGYHAIIKNSFNSFFLLFRMPLFFFISGWVLYKSSRIWDYKTTKTFLMNKFQVQILSTLIFFLIFVHLQNLDFIKAIGTFKAGYWFTYTLFFYFIFYVFSNIISSFFSRKFEDCIIISFALLILIIFYITLVDTDEKHAQIYGIIGIPQWRYYVFFVFGTLIKKYYDSFIVITSNSNKMATIIILFSLLYLFGGNISLPHFGTIRIFLLGFLGITILLTTFRLSDEYFDTNHFIAKSMKYIGRHTLDIYLLHYFFLPSNLTMFGTYFQSTSNPVIELFVSLTIAILVITVCLAVSKVLRTSPILAHYLFGQKI